MLWFDNNPTTNISQKVARAAEYYRSKYGTAPTTCLVNPKMLVDQGENPCTLDIKPDPIVLHHHLWIGTSVEADQTGC